MFACSFALLSAASIALAQPTPEPAPTAAPSPEIVRIDANTPIQIIHPLLAIGSTVDKEPAGSIPSLYSKHNVDQILQAGLGWLSYRLFTELCVQDWHWNPNGTFSAGTSGYWTSSADATGKPITDSFGYRLPHRGFTTDQGNNADYSRLDDGDPTTYWKSDPYLTQAFTGDPDDEHPQWVLVDLGNPHPVDAVRIRWVDPYAVRYRVEYWTGDDPINDPGTGDWQAFPQGQVANGRGGDTMLRVAREPIRERYIRISMSQSSNTCDSHGSQDPRDCVGYAIGEIYVGSLDTVGRFTDYVRHAACGGANPQRYACGWRQTATYVSSVDPWHTSANRVRDQEQPGLDLIARSGLTRGMGAMYPVAMLYSTPENAVNEIRYMRTRGYPIAFVELGEEPDGQYTEPEDDAALFVQWATAIHKVYPDLKLGGPVFSGVNTELQTWPDAHGNISWLNRFLTYLRSHGQMQQLAFMSFEHYPFGGCDRGALLQQDLLQEPSIMKGIVNQWHSDGLPASVPMYISEAGFSAVNFTQVPMQIEGALWQADYVASALANGVRGAVYYQDEPVPLSQNTGCPTDWGNLTMFVADQHAHIRALGAQFYGVQMLTKYWLAPNSETFSLYPAITSVAQGGFPLVTAYAAKTSDDVWSVLLINKDKLPHTFSIQVPWHNNGGWDTFDSIVKQTTFGPTQYVWSSRGAASKPEPDDPPTSASINAWWWIPCKGSGQPPVFTVGPWSITVLQGKLTPKVKTCG